MLHRFVMPTDNIRRVLSEPLLHFLAAGGILFAAYAWVNAERGHEPTAIQVFESDANWLAETWTKQWARQPTTAELRGLVLDFVRESLLAKEAEELGLARDDTVVRRHLAQKMTFLIEGTSRLAEPTGEELRKYYDAHRGDFTTQARISFSQAFFSPELRNSAESEAKAVLVQLSAVDAEPEGVGDRSLIARDIVDADLAGVAAQFGDAFAQSVTAVAPGSWQGPVKSTYGLHLVRVSKFTPARQQTFEEAKAEVARNLREQREREARAAYFAGLMNKYRIELDNRTQVLVGPVNGSEIAN